MKKINKILLELYNDKKQLLVLSVLGYISYLIEGVIPSDPNIIQATGMIWGAAIMGTVTIGGYIIGGISQKKANDLAKENMDMQNDIALEQLAFQKEQQAKLDKQKAIYRNMEFTNPYAEITNPYADLQTQFENVYEDLTVNTLQAEFQAQQGAQQRADIMGGLRGAAGGAGISALAQAMAREGALQTQQISASIGAQEAANQRAAAAGAAGVQQMEAAREQLVAQGEGAVEMTRLGGEAMLQEMEMSRQATLLGISMGEAAGANAAVQRAYANQMAAGAAQANLFGQQAAAQYAMAGQTASAAGEMVTAYGQYKASL